MATAFRRRPLSTADLSWMARRRVSVRPDMPLSGGPRTSTPFYARRTSLCRRFQMQRRRRRRRISTDWGDVFRRIIRGESLRIRDSFNLLVNDGLEQTHLHINPRKAGDQLWPFEHFNTINEGGSEFPMALQPLDYDETHLAMAASAGTCNLDSVVKI